MKKLNLLLLFAILFTTTLFVSCLGPLEDPDPPSKEAETASLKEYLKNLTDLGYNIDTTSMGVYYVVKEKGTGAYALPGDTLTVGYSGYFVSGFLFDSSSINNVDGKWTFILGNPPMIKGWDDGMKVMNKNSVVQFIIPSDLAYGANGLPGAIEPYKTLVFVVKMFEIKPAL